MKPSVFIAASAAIILLLGLVHLLYTFRGPALHPRDPELTAQMIAVSPVITPETTMWRAWIGFNATYPQFRPYSLWRGGRRWMVGRQS